jgi:uncharacterized membrane protein
VLKRELRIKELAREGARGTAEGRVVVFQEARLDDIRECKRRITHKRSRHGMRGSSSQQTGGANTFYMGLVLFITITFPLITGAFLSNQ